LTEDQFVREVQIYYDGKYKSGQMKYIAGWLSKKLPEALPFILSELLKQYSGRFKVMPGIAEFESAAKEVREHRAYEIKQDVPMLPDEEDMEPEQADKVFDMLKSLGKDKKA
jgi:hypothetical protein